MQMYNVGTNNQRNYLSVGEAELETLYWVGAWQRGPAGGKVFLSTPIWTGSHVRGRLSASAVPRQRPLPVCPSAPLSVRLPVSGIRATHGV